MPVFNASGKNTEIVLLSSAARTTDTQSADQTNPHANGALVTLNVSAITASPSLKLRILWRDPISGIYGFLNADPDPVTTTGLYMFQIGPGCVSSGGSIVQSTAAYLPLTWAVLVDHLDADSCTYSVSACMVE